MPAYAELDDLLALFETAPSATRQSGRLEPLLATATDELIDELGGIDFFRHPDAGSATWLVDGEGSALLHLHRGVIELELVEISLDFGRTFIELEADNWRLQWSVSSSDTPPTGEPYFHLRLVPWAPYTAFPLGRSIVRLTGAEGWSEIPPALIEGTAERARQLAYADASYSGSVVASDDDSYGAAIASTGRWPDVTWRFLQREKRRFMSCEQ